MSRAFTRYCASMSTCQTLFLNESQIKPLHLQTMTLTKEQEAIFAAYVDRWIKVALNTEEIDVGESIAAIKQDYAMCGYPEPKRFSVFRSPKSAAFAAAIFKQHYDQRSITWDRYINGSSEIITQD